MSGADAGLRALAADFFGFARGRCVLAVTLIALGAFLEAAGIVLLVPVVAMILGLGGAARTEAWLGWLGLDGTAPRMLAVLGAFSVLLVLRFAVLFWRDDLLTRLQNAFVTDLRARAFRRLAAMPWSELAVLRHGRVGHALTRDVDRVAALVGTAIGGGVSLVLLAVQLALALVLAPAMTLAMAVPAVLLFWALRWLRRRAAAQGQGMTEDDLALFEAVSGFLRGLKPAKAHGLEGAYVVAAERAAGRLAEQQRVFARDLSLARLAVQSAAGALGILAVLLGVFVVPTPPENLIVALVILARLYAPMTAIQNSWQGALHAAAAYRGARAVAGPRAGVPAAPATAERLERAPEIVFDGVTLHGEEGAGRAVLDHVDACIPAGRVTVLTGESGAGKSTLCDLAVGLVLPDSGRVLLDGAPLEGAVIDRLRASVAYVGQEPFLVEETLRQNLTWGTGEVTEEDIWAALETVGAAGLARGLAGGLDGRMRAEGGRFSGGERQRLRLARVLLRRPRVLVLDEATSALDLAAETEVLRRVLEARDGATGLIVSHRPEVRQFADHVIALEKGRIRG